MKTHRRFSGKIVPLKRWLIASFSNTWPGQWIDQRNSVRSIKNPSVSIATSASGVGPKTAVSVFLGTYEASEVRCVKKYLPTNLPVLELGAGIGVVSSHIVRKLHAGPIVCVEANRGNLELLRQNIATNNRNDVEVQVVTAAIDYSPSGTVELKFGSGHLDVAVSSAALGRADLPQSAVKAVTVGQLVDEWDSYCIVADIEGAETGFILGTEPAFDRCELLIIELHNSQYHDKEVSIPELVAGLEDRGFALVHRDGSVYVWCKNRSLRQN